jgi:tyrosinase
LADPLQQVLSEKALEVAEEFTDNTAKARYRKLAEQLRLPYWDWAKETAENELVMPRSMSQLTISITFPNGTRANVDNPISMYRFHPLKPEEILPPYDQALTTIRNANSYTEPSQPEAQEDILRLNMVWRKEQLYVLLSQYQTYNQFSNSGSEWTRLGNIESIHDDIHGTFGLHSHMQSPPVAAFDPGFYFHHANVDRILALLERLHPDTWVTPHKQNLVGTWTIEPESIQDADSPLTPFHRNARGDYHTSATVRQFENFKYTYPELVDNPDNSTLIARINALYQVPITEPFKHKRQEAAPPLAISAEEPRAYLCSIEAPKSVAGTYKVELLLGDGAVLSVEQPSCLLFPQPRSPGPLCP